MKFAPLVSACTCAVLGGAIGACAGSETGNGEVEHRHVAVSMRFDGGALGLVAPDREGHDFAIERAVVLVDELDLALPTGSLCSDRLGPVSVVGERAPYVAACTAEDNKLRVLGPWFVDLVSGELEPPLDALDVPVGPYARIDAHIRPTRPGEDPKSASDALDHSSIDVGGTVMIGGVARDWDLSLTFTDVAQFVPDMPIEIGPEVSSLFLLLDVATWFDDLPLVTCMQAGEVPTTANGTFLLGQLSTRCGNIESAIRREIREAGRLEPH